MLGVEELTVHPLSANIQTNCMILLSNNITDGC